MTQDAIMGSTLDVFAARVILTADVAQRDSQKQ